MEFFELSSDYTTVVLFFTGNSNGERSARPIGYYVPCKPSEPLTYTKSSVSGTKRDSKTINFFLKKSRYLTKRNITCILYKILCNNHLSHCQTNGQSCCGLLNLIYQKKYMPCYIIIITTTYPAGTGWPPKIKIRNHPTPGHTTPRP